LTKKDFADNILKMCSTSKDFIWYVVALTFV